VSAAGRAATKTVVTTKRDERTAGTIVLAPERISILTSNFPT